MADESALSYRKRFPGLSALEYWGQRKIPFVNQLESRDCGAACLTMVLRYHGKWVSTDEVRRETETSLAGTSGGQLLRAAQRYGLQGRGVGIDIDGVRHLPRGSILHWNFGHFVVFDRATARTVTVVDPALGRRTYRNQEFATQFTGVALELRPGLEFRRASRTSNPMMRYLRAVLEQREMLRRSLVTSGILRVVGLAVPLITGTIIDRVIPKQDYELLIAIVIGLLGIFSFQALISIIRSHFLTQLQTNLDLRMTFGFVEHLVSLPYEFFQRRTSGDLLTRVYSNAIVRDVLTHSTLSSILDGLMVLLYFIVIAAIDGVMAWLVFALTMLHVVIFFVTKERYRELTTERLKAESITHGNLNELIHGINTLKSCGAEGHAVQRWGGFYIDEFNVHLRIGRYGSVATSISGVIGNAAYLIPLAYGATTVLNEQLSLGTMLALTSLASAVLGPVGALLRVATLLEMMVPHIDRIQDVRDKQPEQPDHAELPPRLVGEIEVENVSFSYQGSREPALKDIHLRIRAGSAVAIVGQSGSGKSTLASLLIGLYRPTTGTLRFDGHDLNYLDLRALRSQIGIVPQNTQLFLGSFRDNISLFDKGINIERITDAAKAAVIHDEIIRMPMGYDGPVAENGASLSGGQRQRVALARALVRRPPILLLDEASSALDSKTELAIMNNIRSLRCTRIIIAHRLSTIINADVIVVMDKGRIVESGSHGELIQRGSFYRDLVSAQTSTDRQLESFGDPP